MPSRADRTRSFVMPAAAVEELLKKEVRDPSVAQVRDSDQEAALPVRRRAGQGRMMPGANPQRMRQHLEDMQRLMDFMREEMEGIEPDGER